MPGCPCVECTCGDSCQCKPGQPGCDACAAFQQKKAEAAAAAEPKPELASVDAIKKAVAEKAVVVDLRLASEIDDGPRASAYLSLTWDRDAGSMPLDGLPEDKSAPIIVH